MDEKSESDTLSIVKTGLPSRADLIESVRLFYIKFCLLIRSENSNRTQKIKASHHSSSFYGEIYHQRASTAPGPLVLRIMKQEPISAKPVIWGQENEALALKKYTEYQMTNGHSDIVIAKAGFVISEEHPFLGVSPDAYVYDTSNSVFLP